MLRLLWNETARADAKAIVSYIADRNPSAATELTDAIGACAEGLAGHPFFHRLGRLPNMHEALVHPNYVLVYRVRSNDVEILSVMHTCRQYPPPAPELSDAGCAGINTAP